MQRAGAGGAGAPISAIAARRIQAELHEWQLTPPEHWTLVECEDPLRTWLVRLQGSGLYAGESFTLRITFGADYPMNAPEFCFVRPAPLHPHVYSNGHICLDILYDSGAWSPALTMASVARSLQSMLATSPGRTPPAGDEQYCRNVGEASSRRTRWTFHDDTV